MGHAWPVAAGRKKRWSGRWRAFRWGKMLANGVRATLEGPSPSVSRVLRLTQLAPQFVEAILDGLQPVELGLDDPSAGFPLGRSRPGGSVFGLAPATNLAPRGIARLRGGLLLQSWLIR